MEGLGTADADRADDVGPVAGSELDRERVARGRVDESLELEVDAGVRGVEVLGHLALHLDLFGRVAGAQAAVPADDHVTRLGLRVRVGQRRRRRRTTRRGRAGGRVDRCHRRRARRRHARRRLSAGREQERQHGKKDGEPSQTHSHDPFLRMRWPMDVVVVIRSLLRCVPWLRPRPTGSAGRPRVRRSTGTDRRGRTSGRTRPARRRRRTRCLR